MGVRKIDLAELLYLVKNWEIETIFSDKGEYWKSAYVSKYYCG